MKKILNLKIEKHDKFFDIKIIGGIYKFNTLILYSFEEINIKNSNSIKKSNSYRSGIWNKNLKYFKNKPLFLLFIILMGIFNYYVKLTENMVITKLRLNKYV